jgi:hypothetical protein
MSMHSGPYTCPDCDEPLARAFQTTSGVGAYKRGDNFNTTPDTTHYLCFLCAKAWKQRLDGPLTPDVVGELSFFTCRDHACGVAMTVTRESAEPTEVELTCGAGHRYAVVRDEAGGLTLKIAG